MSKMKLVRIVAASVLCAWVATAAAQVTVGGRWTGTDTVGGRTDAIVLEIVEEKGVVRGTIVVGEAPSAALSEGKFADGRLTFVTAAFMNGREVRVTWDGEVKGDSVSLVRTFGAGGPKLPAIALRRGSGAKE
jgi:hypothetical protein